MNDVNLSTNAPNLTTVWMVNYELRLPQWHGMSLV